MADTSNIPKPEVEYSEEAMEAEDDEELEMSPNRVNGPEKYGWISVSGSGDDGGSDDQLLKLQQCVTAAESYERQRVGHMLVKMFSTAVDTGTKLKIDDIMHLVQLVVNDPETQVRAELVEQLPHVAIICQDAPHLFKDVLHSHLLGIILKYLTDVENEVRQMAQAAILALIRRGLIDNNTIEVKVCPVVYILAAMATDFLTSGISLMTKIAPLIGTELTEKVFLDKYIDLCGANEFYVRKVCAAHFGELCAAVGRKALLRRLFPVFLDLCGDEIWGVRKTCVDVMMAVSCHLTLQHRRLLLAEVLATHLNDESKWVRISAFQILGPFISTLAKHCTEGSYNQDNEPVLPNESDNRLSHSSRKKDEKSSPSSIRISYEAGVWHFRTPTEPEIRSQPIGTNEYNSKENCSPSGALQPVLQEDNEFQDDLLSLMKSYKSKIQRKAKNEELKHSDDTDKYNPFLYYYIPPELPLDDELVQAAKKSAAESKCDQKPAGSTTASEVAQLNKSINQEADLSGLLLADTEERIDFTGQEIIPRHLIDAFLSMAEPEQCSDMGADIPYHCAFNFPAVALTLGRENWPYLKKAYQALASATQWKVRRTLASSIHEIAIIIGYELTVSDLLPIYDGFIKDLDEVRIGILKHFATFFKILQPSHRCEYLIRLKNFLGTDVEWNWRFREELATQLLEVVNFCEPQDVHRYIVPLCITLLRDKAAAVRHVAVALVTQIAVRLGATNYDEQTDRMIREFYRQVRTSLLICNTAWVPRQLYALLCAQLIAKNAIAGSRFCQMFLRSLLELSSDSVPNVRLAVARTLSRNVITMGPEWLGTHAEEVEVTLKQMRLDPDRDVRVLAGGDETPATDITTQNKTEQQRNILF